MELIQWTFHIWHNTLTPLYISCEILGTSHKILFRQNWIEELVTGNAYSEIYQGLITSVFPANLLSVE